MTLDEVMQAILDGFAKGSAGTDLTIYAIATAMRTARSQEIAELAVRWQDAASSGSTSPAPRPAIRPLATSARSST